jgi:3-oxoacyl-[acyl-carrier-protein] synthase II
LENACKGVSGAGFITYFDASKFKTQFACEVKGFDPLTTLLDRKDAHKMDLYTQFALVVADEAVKDSGVDIEKEDRIELALYLEQVLVVFVHLRKK